jgi:hypothetical protein
MHPRELQRRAGSRTAQPAPGSPVRSGTPPSQIRLLQLQRQAGNTAVTAMLAGLRPHRPVVQRLSAQATLGSWMATSHPTDRYLMKVKAITTDPIGHAWISVERLQEPVKSASVGFWPAAWYSGLIGPGVLFTPDPHEGEEGHVESAEIDHEHFRALLDVVNTYETRAYSLILNNCADFAHAAWQASTGQEFNAVSDVLMWDPALIGMNIDQANRARGLDGMGRPIQDGQRSQ